MHQQGPYQRWLNHPERRVGRKQRLRTMAAAVGAGERPCQHCGRDDPVQGKLPFLPPQQGGRPGAEAEEIRREEARLRGGRVLHGRRHHTSWRMWCSMAVWEIPVLCSA